MAVVMICNRSDVNAGQETAKIVTLVANFVAENAMMKLCYCVKMPFIGNRT